jgi:hypothetical protein
VNLLDARSRAPRISLAAFRGVAVDNVHHHATLTNNSTMGLRVEGPYRPSDGQRRVLQLEIELPGVDEVLWASAIVTRAIVTPLRTPCDEKPRFWCRAGLRLGETSRSERRLLHDYVIESLRARAFAPDRRAPRHDRRT